MNTLLNACRAFGIAALLLSSLHTVGQVRRVAPVPTEGYWVVETTPRPNRQSIAYFYNNDHVLMYREGLKRSRVNIRRAHVAERLNAVLVQAARHYAATKQRVADQNWVAAQFN